MHPSNLAELIKEMGLDKKWFDEGFGEGYEEGIEIIKRLQENVSPEIIASDLHLPAEEVEKFVHLLQITADILAFSVKFLVRFDLPNLLLHIFKVRVHETTV